MKRKGLIAATIPLIAALMWPAAGAAQSWERPAGGSRQNVSAQAVWAEGLAISVTCRHGRFNVLVRGHAPSDAPYMRVRVGFDDAAMPETGLAWRTSGEGQVLLSRQPAYLARNLLHASRFTLEVADEGRAAQTFELTAPGGQDVLADVLRACNRPLDVPPDLSAVIAQPDWAGRPSARRLGSLIPRRARAEGISGMAVVQCRVSVRGETEDCIILSEDPPEIGFGAATVDLARDFRMHPLRINGEAVDEGVVEIPVRWNLQ